MDKPDYDVYDPKCPTRQALDRIADKWTSLIVGLLVEPLASIRRWAERHIEEVQTARDAYLRPTPAPAVRTPRIPPGRPGPRRSK